MTLLHVAKCSKFCLSFMLSAKKWGTASELGDRVQPRGWAACLRHNNTIHWVQAWVLTPLWQHTIRHPGIETASLILLVQGSIRPAAGESVAIVPGRQDGGGRWKAKKERTVYLSARRERAGAKKRGDWKGPVHGIGLVNKRKKKIP